jgi:hypothetical protein
MMTGSRKELTREPARTSGIMVGTMQTPAHPVCGRVMWIPLVLVGAFLYWTTALGLGGLSLTFLGGSEEEDLALDPALQSAYGAGAYTSSSSDEPIVVHLESPPQGTAGVGGQDLDGLPAGDDGTASLPAIDDAASDSTGPGPTSY